MSAPQPQRQLSQVRFGVFEADLNSRELFKCGSRIKIQDQPFEILCVLLERAGETVSRQELRQRLWPDNTFVEYENSLNTAVGKLRAALSDSSDQPRYIETVARHGYRFVAPIIPVTHASPARSAILVAPRPVRPASRVKWRPWVPAAMLVVLITVLLMTRPIPVPHLVAITPLTHSSFVHPHQKVLTDGPRLYFLERVNGRWVPKWMPAPGGSAVTISLPFFADLQDISPDGSELVLRELRQQPGGDTWTFTIADGALHRLGIGTVGSAAYMPDGRSLLYSQGSQVFVCDHNGRNRRPLLALAGEVFAISVSPDGKRLRFVVNQGPDLGLVLWQASADGSQVRRVIDDHSFPRAERGGNWSPDGRWYTFAAPRPPRVTGDVWLLGTPGWFRRRPVLVPLTAGPEDFSYPMFSRNGKRIFAVGETRRGELVRYDFAKRDFTPFLGGISAEYVAFSPDKQSMVYVSYPGGELWRARADGSQPVPMTVAPMQAGFARWSPNGLQIAFEGRPTQTARWNLYLISARGGIPQLLAENIARGGFSWTHEGKGLIFSNSDDANAPVRVVNIARHSIAPLPGSQHGIDLSLSPSGRYLLMRVKGAQMVVFDLLTRRTRRLVAATYDLGYPEWSTDEHYAYFNRFLGASPAYYRVRIADGVTERLMQLTEFSAVGNWGSWSTMAPDGSLLLLRGLGGSDLYAIDWSER